MNTNKQKFPSTEQIKKKWENLAKTYINHIEEPTMQGTTYFFKKFLEMREEHGLNKDDLHLGEIACGSGMFMENILTNKIGKFKKIKMFDLASAMIKGVTERFKALEKKIDICVSFESKKI